jgi:hypothetical protein
LFLWSTDAPNNGEWADYNTVVCISVAKSGIIVIDNNIKEDDVMILYASAGVKGSAMLANTGAKLTQEVFFNLWKYSSLVPRQRRQKISCWWWQTVLVRGE